MNDRYLFRGKRIGTDEWAQGFYFQSKDDHMILADLQSFYHIDGREWYDDWSSAGSLTYVDHATVGQCTGLRDKNGKLIFEGHWISAVIGDDNGAPIVAKGEEFVVVYNEEYAGFCIEDGISKICPHATYVIVGDERGTYG